MSAYGSTDDARAIRALDAITNDDPERAHGLADAILLDRVTPEVRDAYLDVVGRCDWWAAS